MTNMFKSGMDQVEIFRGKGLQVSFAANLMRAAGPRKYQKLMPTTRVEVFRLGNGVCTMYIAHPRGNMPGYDI